MSDERIDTLNAALEGRYALERELGQGGMATVYLAEDLKHRRQVALKVMKPELTAVVGAERFLTEIETTANLTHPHILPLHDSGEADGFLFYVMPYVEGESLREKLDREKQLPVEEAVQIARDLAESLDYAHRHGVIHRDIKPANILMHEGRPLIADFGIALAVGAAGGPRVTETGLSLGTPHYMSPEQATGDQMVGPQSDIYALGALLFEMLVGEPPYTGATAQAVLGKIIAGGAVSATQARSSIPPNVDAAIRKALERLPADRFAAAAGFGAALADASFRHGIGATAEESAAAGRWKAMAFAASAAAVIFAGGMGWQMLEPEAPRPVARFGIELAPGQDLIDIVPGTFAVTPDASALVYAGPGEAGGTRLWVKPRSVSEAEPLAGTDGALTPTVSPDGRWILYRVGAQLRKIPLLGGASITLSDSINNLALVGAAWLDDGTLVFPSPRWSLLRIPAEGGTHEELFVPPEGQFAFAPVAVPNSSVVLFSICDGGCVPDDLHESWAVDAESGEARRVGVGGLRAHYSPTGHLVFVRPDGSAFAVPFDPSTLEAGTSPVPVLEGVKVDGGVGADMAVARDGTLIFLSGGAISTEAEFVWVSRDGGARPVDPGWTFDPGGANQGWSLSPTDDRLALRANTDAGFDIWVKELRAQGPLSRLTFDPGGERMPRWIPDGEWVTFLSPRNGDLDVWMKRADGTGEAELLYDHAVFLAQGFYAPDGETLVLRTGGQAGVEGGRDILAFRPGTDSVATPLLAAAYDEWAPNVSPNGRWLAYQSEETGQNEVFVRPFPDVNSGKWQISSGGATMPLWSHSGDELFYIDADRNVVSAQIQTEPGFKLGERRVLFELGSTFQTSTITGMWDITSDDQTFLMARAAGADDEPTRMILVQNWWRELEGLAGR